MKLTTDYYTPDEKCWGLFELEFQSPGSKGFHRYQIIEVIRDGQVAEYRKDMGSTKKVRGDQFRIPCLLEHTVGEAQDIADWMRVHSVYDKKELVGTNNIK